MEVYIGANSSILLDNAKAWVTDRDVAFCFDELENWATAREGQWGSCYVFIEVVLPLPPRTERKIYRNQIDMLICFSDRLALCEVKRYRAVTEGDIAHWYEQIEKQGRLLDRFVEDNGLDRSCVSRFLFLPKSTAQHLMEIGRLLVDIHAAPHIWPSGANAALRGVNRNRDAPCYLPEALEQCLSRRYTPISDQAMGLQEVLKRQLSRKGNRLLPFKGFKEVTHYLNRAFRSFEQPFVSEAWHIRELRGHALSAAKTILLDKGFVEILGVPDIGKSALVKDLINEFVSETSIQYKELPPLPHCNSLRDVVTFIYEKFYGDYPVGLGQQETLEHLARECCVFWIPEYTRTSITALQQFLQRIQSLYANARERVNAYWILESVSALQGSSEYQVELEPLANKDVAQILQRIKPGGAFLDPEEVIHLSQGNPGRAIKFWQSTTRLAADASSDLLMWIQHQLSQEELRLFPLLCIAVTESPLGISLVSLAGWISFICKDLPASFTVESLVSLLEKLERHQVVHVVRAEPESFGGLLDEILPKDIALVVINTWNSRFMDEVLNSLGEAKRKDWTDKFTEFLLDVASIETSLAYVTMEIHCGSLESFFRSSFRFSFSSVAPVLSWLDRIRWQAKDVTQTYLLKVLRYCTWLAQHGEVSVDTVEREVGKPQEDNATQCYAFSVAKAYTVAHLQPNADFDFSSWNNQIEACTDAALQTEMLVRTADALLNQNRFSEAWHILENVLKRRHLLSQTAKCLILDQALRYLNRTKVSLQVFHHEPTVFQMIDNLVPELTEIALTVENLAMLSNALFYYSRSHEYSLGRVSHRDVLRYLLALEFIEKTSPSRRIQALLTQGSIHRHFCRSQDIEWPEFWEHMEAGTKLYLRAFESARVGNHITHELNAVSYMMDFCLKSLRFGDNQNARKTIAERCKEAIEHADKVKDALQLDITRELDEEIMRNIQFSHSILSYVTTVSNPMINADNLKQLEQSFDIYASSFLEEIRKGRPIDSKRLIGVALRDLNRMLSFGQQYPRQYQVLSQVLNLYLRRLLDRTEVIASTNKSLRSAWKRLYSKVGAERI